MSKSFDASQLSECFSALQQGLRLLCQQHKTVKEFWSCSANSANTDLIQALTDIWYQDGQDGRETRIYPGLVQMDTASVEQTIQVNELKIAFRTLCAELRKQFPGELDTWKAQQWRRLVPLKQALEQNELARLHLKQSSRTLFIIERPLAKLQFSWYTSGRSIKRLTVTEAWDKLVKIGLEKPHIRVQADILASLPTTTVLAQVQQQAPVLRANLFYVDGSRQAINCAMPIVLPKEFAWPVIKDASTSPPTARQRQPRSDIKIEEQALIPSLRLHRYTS